MKQILRLHFLGPFKALGSDGEPVELTSKKARALLAYLAVEHEPVVESIRAAESDAPVFRQVMEALRDTEQNPEWKYVLEGPEWWGRRVGNAEDFFARD